MKAAGPRPFSFSGWVCVPFPASNFWSSLSMGLLIQFHTARLPGNYLSQTCVLWVWLTPGQICRHKGILAMPTDRKRSTPGGTPPAGLVASWTPKSIFVVLKWAFSWALQDTHDSKHLRASSMHRLLCYGLFWFIHSGDSAFLWLWT